DLGNDLRRRLLVLEMGAARQDARAIGTADDDVDMPRRGSGHQALQCVCMVQQRVAPSEQEAVRLRLGEVKHKFAGLDPIATQAPALDYSLFAHLCQGTECACAGQVELRQPRISVEVLGNVVDPYEVNAIDAEPL